MWWRLHEWHKVCDDTGTGTGSVFRHGFKRLIISDYCSSQRQIVRNIWGDERKRPLDFGDDTGQGASSSGKYAATITDFYNTGATHSGSVAATYVTGSSINGTLTETGISNITFNGTAISGSSFNYNSPAVVSDIDGVWSGTIQDGTTAIIVIKSNGTFTGSDSGCAFSGTLTPDSSGKNFLNISLTYGGSPCLSPGQVQSGVAVDYLLSDGVTRQLLAGVVSGNTAGTFFVANK